MHSVIPAETGKLAQPTCKVAYIPTRRISLKKVFENTANLVDGKFQPNWEGPYTAVRVGIAKSYALSRLDRTTVPMMWYVMHLKKYYQ